ncbi:MAG: TPM domain-containing protein [Clostridia bacterium]|nr:TPM domain-containing protein [Clostridia bacterium]
MKKILSIAITALICALLLLPVAAMPDWYPEDVYSFEDFYGTDLKQVVDDADIFTDAEEKEFTAAVNSIISKYGYDLVIFTDVSTYGVGEQYYPVDFYRFNGYGKGAQRSGSVFFICMEPGNRYWWSAGTGAAERYYNYENVNALDDRIEPYMRRGEYAEAVRVYLQSIDELYTNGTLVEEVETPAALKYLTIGGISSIVGLITGAIVSGKEKAKMRTVAYATYANDYIVQNSFALRDLREAFLYKNVTRTVISTDSDRGGGGGSSHSSGYHSSGGGGGSFSGGGRHF